MYSYRLNLKSYQEINQSHKSIPTKHRLNTGDKPLEIRLLAFKLLFIFQVIPVPLMEFVYELGKQVNLLRSTNFARVNACVLLLQMQRKTIF